MAAALSVLGIDDMPAEIVAMIFGCMDDWLDLHSVIKASKGCWNVYKANPAFYIRLLVKSIMDPELLKTALTIISLGGDSSINTQLSAYLDHTIVASLPHDLDKLKALVVLSQDIELVADHLINVAMKHNQAFMEDNQRSLLENVEVPHADRAALVKSVYDYEILARTIGLGRSANDDFVPLQMERALIAEYDAVKIQRLNTIHKWIKDDMCRFVAGFEGRFIQEVLCANKPETKNRFRKIFRRKLNPNNATINAREALLDTTELSSIFNLRTQVINRTPDKDRFATSLESKGCRFYRKLLVEDPDTRHKRILSEFRKNKRTAFLEGAISDYYAVINAPTPRTWFNHMDGGDTFPNMYVEKLVLTLRRLRNRAVMGGEEREYLLKTGWWFWSDAFMTNTLKFEDAHDVFRMAPLNTWRELKRHCEVVHRQSNNQVTLPGIDECIPPSLQSPLKAWEKIVERYQVQ
ncbi:hypothetical protein GGR57DRAFT_501575 [Xylariaceae sp. FL1272]|nr:hypothetical protein GGR57DRAFT_501575 [Xylariaceae sp. FL1272]